MRLALLYNVSSSYCILIGYNTCGTHALVGPSVPTAVVSNEVVETNVARHMLSLFQEFLCLLVALVTFTLLPK